MKKSILIGLLSAVFLSGCGRPDNYKEMVKIDFSGAFAALTAQFNQGVLIVAQKDSEPGRKKFYWVNPNINNVTPKRAHFEPGLWKFFAIGFSGSSFADGSLTFKCDSTSPITLGFGENPPINLNLSTCNSSNDFYAGQDSGKISKGNDCKSRNMFHCGGTF